MYSSRRSVIRYNSVRNTVARVLKFQVHGAGVYRVIQELQDVVQVLENLHCGDGLRIEVDAFTSRMMDVLSVLHVRRREYEEEINMSTLA
jgi:hypothetical protein